MARKKRKRTRKKTGLSLTDLSIDEIREKGKLYLQQEKFQDAIKCFKELLKQGEDAENLALLAQAYQGRIRNFAAKSMLKEALALLNTLEQRCGAENTESVRLLLQLKAGNYDQAAQLFNRCRCTLERKEIQRIEIMMGGLLLLGNDLQPSDLNEQSPVVLHYPLAKAALQSYCQQEMDTTHEALQAIPFRSPYRDFRTLLTGCLHWQQDKEKAADLLRKIQSSSPYFHCASRLLSSLEPTASILKKIAGCSKNEQQKIREQFGLSIQQFRLFRELAQPGIKPVALYKIVKKYSALFSREDKFSLYRQILPFCGEMTLDILPRLPEINLTEKIRLTALAAENSGMYPFAVDFWEDYLRDLEGTPSAHRTETALILRHQTKLMGYNTYEFSPDEILEKQLKSLEIDPTHAETWLNASKLAARFSTLNKYYKIINEAVEKLPENVSILLAAMKAAGQRGAHKKAGTLAQRVLSIDPINISALDFLAESHLEHARRLASQKKWALAEKELSKTDTRVKAVRLRGRRQICLGMILLLQNKEEGLDDIAAGKKENGTALLGHVLASLEARLYTLPARFKKSFDKELRQAGNENFNRTEFLRLINWLHGFTGKQWLALKECSHLLKKYFLQAATVSWSREEGLSLCKALDRAELHVAMARISGRSLKQHPKDIDFRAYHLLATYLKNNGRFTGKQGAEYIDVVSVLTEKGKFDLLERLEDAIDINSTDFIPWHDEEEIFEYDTPFKMPKHVQEEQKKKPKKPQGKQLNLFEDFL